MQGEKGSVQSTGKGGLPFDQAASQQVTTTTPTPTTLLAQVNTTQSSLGDLNTQLTTKNLKLTGSQRYILNNKLADAHSNLRKAASKTGVELEPLAHVPASQGPIAKFLNYVSSGEKMMSQAKGKLQEINDSGDSVNPAKLLLVQVDLNRAQTLLEYSSVILGKAVDATKTLFNTQM